MELMRHASIQTTMNVYGRGKSETKRQHTAEHASYQWGVLRCPVATATC